MHVKFLTFKLKAKYHFKTFYIWKSDKNPGSHDSILLSGILCARRNVYRVSHCTWNIIDWLHGKLFPKWSFKTIWGILAKNLSPSQKGFMGQSVNYSARARKATILRATCHVKFVIMVRVIVITLDRTLQPVGPYITCTTRLFICKKDRNIALKYQKCLRFLNYDTVFPRMKMQFLWHFKPFIVYFMRI